jgi:hypothetical protein
MPAIFAVAKRIATRTACLALLPTLVVCSGDKSTGTTLMPPGTVSDLSVSAIANTSVTLSFTQVDDGTGQAASYDVRYAVAPMSWGSASSTASGTCATPVAGTGVGSPLTCSILGLTPLTNYTFQLISFRGTLSSGATFGGVSNVASASTTSQPPPPAVVTTVIVAPSTASIVVGATVSLSATVKDALGNVMTGQSVTWSTSNAGAATVSATGVVTGVGAGSATISATCAGKSGTSGVTVSSVPPPPPPGGTLLFQENFEDANLALRGWYDNTGVVLSTVEHISGSNSSAEYRFLPGATVPTSGTAQRHKFTASSSVYISFYVKYSANWVGSQKAYHPHEFYVMSTLDGDFDGPAFAYMTLYLEHNYQNGGKPVMMMQDNKSINTTSGALPNNLVGSTENRSTAGCNGLAESNLSITSCYNAPPWANAKGIMGPVVFQPTAGAGYKNNWNFVEAYYQLNTIVNGIGQADGVMQYWFNGTLVIDRHDILYRTGAHPTLQFSQFLIAPYIGDGSPVDQSMFIDNVRVATARIP